MHDLKRGRFSRCFYQFVTQYMYQYCSLLFYENYLSHRFGASGDYLKITMSTLMALHVQTQHTRFWTTEMSPSVASLAHNVL